MRCLQEWGELVIRQILTFGLEEKNFCRKTKPSSHHRPTNKAHSTTIKFFNPKQGLSFLSSATRRDAGLKTESPSHSCLAEKYIIGEINEKRLLTLVGSKHTVYHPLFNLLLPSTQSMLKSFLIYMKTKLKPVYEKGKL